MKTIIDAINEAAVSKLAEDMVFPTMRDAAIQCANVEEYLSNCTADEDQWFKENHTDEDGNPVNGAVKHVMYNPSTGKTRFVNTDEQRDSLSMKGWLRHGYVWKRRTLLPTKYTSAKSTVKKAMEAGVTITTDMGKTAMGKATKELAVPKIIDYNQEAIKLGKKLDAIAPYVDEAIWDSIVTTLKDSQTPF